MKSDTARLLRAAHWPRDLAMIAAERIATGALAPSDLRRIDRFLQEARNGGRSGVPLFSAAHWERLPSLWTLGDAMRAVAVLDPSLVVQARPILKARRSEYWTRSRAAVAPAPVPQKPRLSVPPDRWAAPWRDALVTLRRRSTAASAQLVSLDPGTVYTAKTLGTLTQTVGQLVHDLQNAGLPDTTLSTEAVDQFLTNLLGRRLRPAAIAARLKELAAWGVVINADAAVLTYVRGLKNSFTLQASRTRKRKQERLLELDLRLGEIFVRAQELHREGLASPHTAAGRWQRMDAALIALSVNAPLRCGDLHRLRIGRDVVRGVEGWSLATRQAKTGHPYCIDRLWTEVGVILDTLVLDGYPETALAERLRTRDGMPLFTQDGRTPADDLWPTKVWRRHFGIGAHIVRTLWASFYAENDPAQAWAASAMLGHSDPRSRKDYEVAVQRRKAACTGQGLMANLILGIQSK